MAKFSKLPHMTGWNQCPHSGALIASGPSNNLQRIEEKKNQEAHRMLTESHQEHIGALKERAQYHADSLDDLRQKIDNLEKIILGLVEKLEKNERKK